MSGLDALQQTLAAEHAALFEYGVYGARVSQSSDPALYAVLEDGYGVHRGRRDRLRLMIEDLDAEPVPAEAVYRIPRRLLAASRIMAAALATESTCGETYAAQVAQTVGAARRFAVTALAESALQQVALGAPPTPFPGAPDLG